MPKSFVSQVPLASGLSLRGVSVSLSPGSWRIPAQAQARPDNKELYWLAYCEQIKSL
ncbi:hypothetical protein QUA07_25080 [Microcoleus sp. T3_A4]|uniref:hypothetical protein n=1 Tax=Microcoleus sp. T3_A4 TaxID=2818968 RepID=UPI002FD10D53